MGIRIKILKETIELRITFDFDVSVGKKVLPTAAKQGIPLAKEEIRQGIAEATNCVVGGGGGGGGGLAIAIKIITIFTVLVPCCPVISLLYMYIQVQNATFFEFWVCR